MSESAINLMAALGILYASRVFYESDKDDQAIKKKLHDLRYSRCFSQFDTNEKRFWFSNLKQSALNVVLAVKASTIKGLDSKTFSRTFHDTRKGWHSSMLLNIFNHNFFQGQAGGQFTVNLQGQKVKVDIRQCNIHLNLLRKREPVGQKLIQGYQPKYQSVSIYLLGGLDLVIAGILTYNLQKKQWVILPSFMMPYVDHFGQPDLGQAYKYLHQNASRQNLTKLLSFIFITTTVALRARSIGKMFRNIFKKISNYLFKKKDKTTLDNIQYVLAKESDRLRCECGKTLSVIYKCKHLSSCQTCYQSGRNKSCRLCGELGDKVMRVFT